MAPPDLKSPSASSSNGVAAPAGYGRSCTNCSRAKCKCILRPATGTCERCHRLGKECNPIAATRKKVEKKHVSSRTAQLEEKLDDLVSILRSTQGGVGQAQNPQQSYSNQNGSGTSNINHIINNNNNSSGSTPQGHNLPTSRLDSLATAATASGSQAGYHSNTNLNANYNASDENSEPTPAESELYLQKFRGWLKGFPFMHIPPDMTAANLKEEKPFLWLCIMNVGSMSVSQMAYLNTKVRRELGEILIVRHEPSMDVLQGILAYLGWATMSSGSSWKPFFILFAQLAQSIMYELGWTRGPAEEQHFATYFRAWGTRQLYTSKPRTLEERRCLLSLWFLKAIASTFIGRLESLQWTPFMEDSLNILDREREHQSDEVLVTLVKLQRIGDDAHKLMMSDVVSGEDPAHTPSFVHQKSLANRLRAVREMMPPTANANYVVQAHSYAVESMVHSMGQFKSSMPETQRIDSLYSCLRASRAWYDIWFSMPLADIVAVPFAYFTQLLQTQLILYRLTTTDDPAWDKDLLRSTADLLVILDRTIERLEAVASVYPIKATEDEGTLFTKAIKMMKSVKANWEPTLTQNLRGMPTPNSQATLTAGNSVGPSGNEMNPTMPMTVQGPMGPEAPMDLSSGYIDPVTMDFNDLAWMTDVFGPWEF